MWGQQGKTPDGPSQLANLFLGRRDNRLPEESNPLGCLAPQRGDPTASGIDTVAKI